MQTQLRVGKKSTAFTIVEIMTVIVIMAILIAAGIPAMESMLRNTQSITTASRLASSLRLAKWEWPSNLELIVDDSTYVRRCRFLAGSKRTQLAPNVPQHRFSSIGDRA